MLVYLVLSYYEIQLNIFCRDKVKEDILFNAYLNSKKKVETTPPQVEDETSRKI